MSGVDDRVVSMSFDNALFERKMSETIKGLDKLKQSLEMAGSTKGLTELGAAAKTFDISNISAGIEGVSGKFLALSTVGITALASIATKAISAGAQLLSSFTVTPILDGFREFETNMNSIQTILANTKSEGTSLDQVNAALDQLNQYSDQTIYNFSEMARNIGTFTAAGVGLDDSVNAIKGIANLAAISGSNSQQASTAMYQLSQALAAGKVSLMDWNSVVNAGMGGEVFKKALFETGKAMKTITDVPLSASFEDWEKKGGTFREQMEKGWITADVLKTTLGAFSGDLDASALSAMGFSDAAAQEMVDLGKLGIAAATEVKTLTQLISTVKESVGSGWSTTFRTVIGDFAESKELFTDINNAIGGFVGRSADARNALLQGWKDMGGRTLLIDSFKTALSAVGDVAERFSHAFREFFPRTTVEDLLIMTKKFSEFAESLKMGGVTLSHLQNVFRGFFAILSIGWEVVKGVVGVIADLFSSFSGAGGGALDFASNTGLLLVNLQRMLVEGGAIKDFFDKISDGIQKAIGFIKNFVEKIHEFIGSFGEIEAVSTVTGRVTERLGLLETAAQKVSEAWSWMKDAFKDVGGALDEAWGVIDDWFSELGAKLAAAFEPGDFDKIIDVINVGLLGGIALLLKKFLSGGLKVDFGGGLVEKITQSFEGLTGALKAMQADLKAKALIKIAGAVAILTASIAVLSLIDSAALAKALTALTIGFGQLIGAMTLLDKIDFGTSTVKLNGLAAGMILIAAAAAILSIAIKNLSDLGWEELAKGLAGVAVGIGTLVLAVNLISEDSGPMIRAGIGMTAMSVALLILSEAVKSFSEMSWGEMARGLTGVGAGLGIIVLAVNNMPVNMALTGPALIAVAIALRLLFEAVEAFSTLSWSEMGKGMAGLGGGLLIIAGAMQLMPINLPITAAGLVLVAIAMRLMAEVMEEFGGMSWGEIAKGLAAIAGLLVTLAAGLTAMIVALPGAAALVVASGALLILTHVLKEIAGLSLGDLAKGIGAIAAVLIVLAGGALLLGPVIPLMLAMGVALATVGVSFALFGVGAILVAKSFEIMAESGKAGIDAIIETIKRLIGALPEVIGAIVSAATEIANQILEAAPVLIKNVKILIMHILDTVIELAPKVAETISTIVPLALDMIRKYYPQVIALGFDIFMQFLKGIRDHIGEITTTAIEIFDNFADALSADMTKLVDAALKIIFAFKDAMQARMGDIIAAGTDLLISLIMGILNHITKVVDAITTVITTILSTIGGSIVEIVAAGLDVLLGFLDGILDNIDKVVDAVVEVITSIIDTAADAAGDLIDAGLQTLTDFLQGITDNLVDVIDAVAEMVTEFVNAWSDNSQEIIDAGVDALVDFLTGIGENLNKIIFTVGVMVGEFIKAVEDNGERLITAGVDALLDFLKGIGDNMIKIVYTVGVLIGEFLRALGDNSQRIIDAGVDLIVKLVKGIGDNVQKIVDAGVYVIAKFMGALAEAAVGLADTAFTVLTEFLNGLATVIRQRDDELGQAGWNIAGAIIEGIITGLTSSIQIRRVISAAIDIARAALDAVRSFLGFGKSKQVSEVGKSLVKGLALGMGSSGPVESSAESLAKRIHASFNNIMGRADIGELGDISPVITPVLDLTKVRAASRGLDGLMSVSAISPQVSFRNARMIATTTDLENRGMDQPTYSGPQEIKFEQNNYSPQALSTSDIYRNTRSQIALAKEELAIP